MLRSAGALPEASQSAALARMFSARVVQELARDGRSPLFTRLVHQTPLPEAIVPNGQVRGLFDKAFSLLRQRKNRHEYVYKSALAGKVLMGRHNLNTACMLTEFRVDGCRADVAIFNGTSSAYEVKSERDKLVRLPDQLCAYLRAFARVSVVTGGNHVDAILDSVPSAVGVMVLTNRYQLSTIRAAEEDRDRIEPSVVFGSLRTHEVRNILLRNNVDAPMVPNTKERSVLRELFEQLSPRQVHDSMVLSLRESRGHESLAALMKLVPQSLRAAVFSTQLKRQDYPNLADALEAPWQDALAWA